MDQSAFRSLLSAPRDPAAESSSSSKKALGKAAPKRGWGIKSKDSKAYEKPKEPVDEKPAFAPRATHKKILEEGGYKDRAALRRKGVDDEYKPVEKLLEDFERTAKESGAAEEEISKQRAYLGGDAEHSILVKGLDYALLAARKAELAREHEEVADDELDELVKDVGKPGKTKGAKAEKTDEEKKKAEADRLGKGFKSIAQKEAELAEKKMKKKKKKKVVAAAPVAKQEAPMGSRKPITASSAAGPSKLPSPPPAPKAEPEPIEEDEDIFADAGEYDLGANLPSDEEDEDVPGPSRTSGRSDSRSVSRSRSRSRSRGRGERDDRDRSRSYDERDERQRRRSYSYSRSRSRSRSRSVDRRRDDSSLRSRERYDDRRSRDVPRERSTERSRERYDERDRDRGGRNGDYGRDGARPGYDDRYDRRDGPAYRGGDGGRRNEEPRYSRRERSYSPDRGAGNKRRRYDSPSPPPRRHYNDRRDSRDRYDSRSPPRRRSPPRNQSPIFRSASPPHSTLPTRRGRSATRSTTPPLFTTMPPPLSRSPSPSSSQGDAQPYRIPKKLAPLQGSAIADVGAFLSFDKDAAKADEKRAKKAAWRAKQGLGPQEGDGGLPGASGSGGGGGDDEYSTKKKEGAERMRANNDYMKIMKKVGEKGGGA